MFEYRIDGVVVDNGPHPVVIGDIIHDTVCVDGRANPVCPAGPATTNLHRQQHRRSTTRPRRRTRLGLRLDPLQRRPARGPDLESVVDPAAEELTGPTSKQDCKRGGWKAFEFRNQGQCIKFVKNAGNDPHDDDDERHA